MNYQSANLKLHDCFHPTTTFTRIPLFYNAQIICIGVAVGTLLFWLLGFYSAGYGKWVAIVVPLLMGLGASYYSVQFYNVAFDEDFIYFSRFRREEKLSLDSVTDIKVAVFPLRMFI